MVSTPCRGGIFRGRLNAKKNERILDAATELFVELGFDAAPMDKIAARAGVSKQTVYSHFGSKEALFSAVVTRVSGQMLAVDMEAADSNCSLEAELNMIGRNFLRLITSDESRAVHRIATSPGDKDSALGKLFYESGPRVVQSVVDELLVRWRDRGALQIDNLERARVHFLSLVNGEYHMRFMFGVMGEADQDEFDEHIAAAVRAFIKIYGHEHGDGNCR